MQSNHIFLLIGIFASLLGVYFSFCYFIYYRGLIETEAADPDKYRRLIRIAQLVLLVSSLAFTGSIVRMVKLSRTALPPAVLSTLTPDAEEGFGMPGSGELSSTPIIFSSPLPTLSSESSPTPEDLPGSGIARIGDTNGFGVFVRTEPGLQYEIVTQLSDGSRVELTGEAQIANGFTWQRVRLEDGRIGWIADNFLIPEP